MKVNAGRRRHRPWVMNGKGSLSGGLRKAIDGVWAPQVNGICRLVFPSDCCGLGRAPAQKRLVRLTRGVRRREKLKTERRIINF